MKKENKNIDDLFKEELGSYTETPPPAVWDALEKRIGQPNGPRLVYRRLGYFALLLLVVSLSVSVARMLTGYAPATQTSSSEGQPIAGKQDAAPVTGNATTKDVPTKEENNNGTTTDNKEGKEQGTNSKPATLTASDKVAPAHDRTAAGKKTISTKQTVNGKKQQKNETSAPANEQEYNAVAANKPVKPATVENTATADKAPASQPAAPQKKEIAKPQAPVKNEITHKPKPAFDRWEIGIKGGVEKGFSNLGATKYLVSPYLVYNLSPKLGIMTQPAIKYATVTINKIGNDKSYYKENGDSATNVILYDNAASVRVYPTIPPLWIITYLNSQSHDSIVKSYTNQGTYVEFDLPLMMKYNITSRFAVYGGVNIAYSRYSGVTENTYSANNIGITKVSHAFSRDSAQGAPPPVANVITYQGTSFSNYTGPLYAGQSGLLRCGYIVGFSYEYSKRWLFDALVQQTPTKTDVVGGYNVNFPLSTAYFRFTLGYKLTK